MLEHNNLVLPGDVWELVYNERQKTPYVVTVKTTNGTTANYDEGTYDDIATVLRTGKLVSRKMVLSPPPPRVNLDDVKAWLAGAGFEVVGSEVEISFAVKVKQKV